MAFFRGMAFNVGFVTSVCSTMSIFHSSDLEQWPCVVSAPIFQSFDAKFLELTLLADALVTCNGSPHLVAYDMPLAVIADGLSYPQLVQVGVQHGITWG